MLRKLITESDLKQLAAFNSEGDWVVSLYLNVDGARLVRPQDVELELKDLLHRAERTKPGDAGDKAQKAALAANLAKIESFVTGQWRRNGTKTLVIFSCEARGLWQVFSLPVAARSAISVGPEPQTKMLTNILDRYERFCLVSVDRKKFRLFTVFLGSIEEDQGVDVDEWVPDQVKAGDWAALRQSRIVRHIDDHVMHHLKEVANRTYRSFLNNQCDHLILSGHQEILPRFRAQLHPHVREQVAGEFKLDADAPAEQFLERSLALENEIRAARERELVSQMRDRAAPGGLSVVGLRDTLDALARGQVHTLLLAGDYVASGYLCYTDHYILVDAGACPICGAQAEKNADVVEEMVRTALNQNVKVAYISSVPEFVEGEKVGALLRYSAAKRAG